MSETRFQNYMLKCPLLQAVGLGMQRAAQSGWYRLVWPTAWASRWRAASGHKVTWEPDATTQARQHVAAGEVPIPTSWLNLRTDPHPSCSIFIDIYYQSGKKKVIFDPSLLSVFIMPECWIFQVLFSATIINKIGIEVVNWTERLKVLIKPLFTY